jgi:hypothetical protein
VECSDMTTTLTKPATPNQFSNQVSIQSAQVVKIWHLDQQNRFLVWRKIAYALIWASYKLSATALLSSYGQLGSHPMACATRRSTPSSHEMAVEDLVLDGCSQRTEWQNILAERRDLNRAFDFSSKSLIL